MEFFIFFFFWTLPLPRVAMLSLYMRIQFWLGVKQSLQVLVNWTSSFLTRFSSLDLTKCTSGCREFSSVSSILFKISFGLIWQFFWKHRYHNDFIITGNFKGRLYAHNTNINNRHQTGTNLSKYVWKLKDNQPHSIPYEIEWGILGTDKPFNSVTGVCRLCLLEAYFFMFDEASSTLNTKDEYWSICVHKKYFLLDKVWIALLSLSLSRESFLPFLNPQI